MTFLFNKYSTWYFKIIERAKHRSLDDYCETHHIIPRSLNGSNSRDNLVKLTAREHFICHLLLIKITIGEARAKMAYAIHRMLGSNKYRCPSRLYEAFRIENAYWRTIHATGRKLSEDAKRRIGEATSSRVGPNKGKKFSKHDRK